MNGTHSVRMNSRLVQEFGTEWSCVREITFDNVVYYVAWDAYRVLNMTPSSFYLRNYVNDEHEIMRHLGDENVMQSVHIVAYNWLLFLIIAGNSPECRVLRNKLRSRNFFKELCS